MSELRQFKLANGDEIVCEVIEWNDDETDQIVVRNCLEVCYIMQENARLCTLRPWMLQQIQNEYLQTITSSHITADAQPAEETAMSWKETIEYFTKSEIDLNQGDEPENMETELTDLERKVLKFTPKNKLH